MYHETRTPMPQDEAEGEIQPLERKARRLNRAFQQSRISQT